jgi:DNA-binding CsgD family transcriptional regulator
MPTLPNAIDWERLSERGSAILRTIAVLLAAGYSPREVGLELGTSTRWVLTRLEELADELERLS